MKQMANGSMNRTGALYASVRMSSDQSITLAAGGTQTIAFDTIVTGNGFTISNNRVIIPNGVHHVRISANIYMQTGYTNTSFSINVGVANSYVARVVRKFANNYETWAIPSIVVPCTAGNGIYINVISSSAIGPFVVAADSNTTYLSVEAID